jgi:hypothetical protein
MARGHPAGIGDGALRLVHLAPERPGAARGEGGAVAMRVVLHRVAAPQDLAHQGGMRRRPPADQEEAGLGRVGVQQVEHARRHLRVRSVVEGERHARLALRQAAQIGAEQRPLRVHRAAEQRVVGRQRPEHRTPELRMRRQRRRP